MTFQELQAQIRHLAQDSGVAMPKIIAVSKTVEAQQIIPVLESGHRIFGENRVQEAQEKWPMLREHYPDVELHLLGAVQSNKLRRAMALFSVIHTLESVKQARRIAQIRDETQACPRLLVQVNTGAEVQKAGVSVEDLPVLLEEGRALGLPVEGLMCLPPAGEMAAPHFGLLRMLSERFGLEHLSMGMSGDYEQAVVLGATYVRLGTVIFGERHA